MSPGLPCGSLTRRGIWLSSAVVIEGIGVSTGPPIETPAAGDRSLEFFAGPDQEGLRGARRSQSCDESPVAGIGDRVLMKQVPEASRQAVRAERLRGLRLRGRTGRIGNRAG